MVELLPHSQLSVGENGNVAIFRGTFGLEEKALHNTGFQMIF